MGVQKELSGKFSDCEALQENVLSTKQKSKKAQDDCWFLYFAVFAGSMCFFATGISAVWTSPVIPMLQSNDTQINPLGNIITKYDISLMMLLLCVGTLISIITSGKIADTIGRQKSLLISTSLNTAVHIMLAFAPNMICMLCALVMNGMCLGTFVAVCPIFISEISGDHNRGKFGCLMGVFSPLGQLYCFILGSFCSYRVFALACAFPPFVSSILLMLVIPETPVHLLHKNKRKAAIKSLEKYRGNLSPQEIEKDIQVMEYTIESTTKNNNDNWLSLFTYQPSRRGFLIGLGLFAIQLNSGVGIILPFLGPIFNEAKTSISGNMTSILVGSLKILTFIFVANIVEKFGRKPLMYISSIMCCISLFFLGLYFFMKDKQIENYENYSWLALASIILYIFGYGMGLGPIPVATIGELFNGSIRARAFSLLSFIVIFFNSFILSSYPLIKDYIGVWGCMWIYSGACFLGALFVHFIMPETKGKSINEIQEMLTK